MPTPEVACDIACSHLAAGFPGRPVSVAEAEGAVKLAREFLATRRSDLACRLLEALTARAGELALAWQLLGFAYRDAQRMPEAIRAFDWATQLDRSDFRSAFGLAQSCLEAGLPAANHFRAALRLVPTDSNAIRAFATALQAEGQRDTAEKMLADVVAESPAWIDGHRSLASLRYTAGDRQGFARSYAAACESQPQNLALWLTWFRTVAQARDWIAAAEILDRAEQHCGVQPATQVARLFLASESGDLERASELFSATEGMQDEVRNLALVRHCLRTGDYVRGEQVAEALLPTRAASSAWPYLSLFWRLRGDERAAWLEGSPPYIGSQDLDFAPGELDYLAGFLRTLHTASAPYLEQSVRGGTQTDQQLFLRAEPILQRLKAKIVGAVRNYVAALPPPVEGHPLLGLPRAGVLDGRVYFSGSWSVRLEKQGFNVAHTHPMGWISSALYVSLPSASEMGPPPAGWIRFGTPPPELGLELEPLRTVEPKPGRLVLFPSTMWHSTVPFNDGERLVVAFDVRPPAN